MRLSPEALLYAGSSSFWIAALPVWLISPPQHCHVLVLLHSIFSSRPKHLFLKELCLRMGLTGPSTLNRTDYLVTAPLLFRLDSHGFSYQGDFTAVVPPFMTSRLDKCTVIQFSVEGGCQHGKNHSSYWWPTQQSQPSLICIVCIGSVGNTALHSRFLSEFSNLSMGLIYSFTTP